MENQQRNCRTCGAPMKTIEVLNVPLSRMWKSGLYQRPKGCPVYEAEAYNAADGWLPVEIQIIECADDASAIALAEEWSHTRWRGGLPIRLYKLRLQ